MICGLQFGFLMEHKLRATNRKPLRGGAFCVFACLFEQRHSHPFSATKEEKEEVTVSDSTVTHVPILLRLFSPVKYKKEKLTIRDRGPRLTQQHQTAVTHRRCDAS